jgi:SAM-dependent methyltransferase
MILTSLKKKIKQVVPKFFWEKLRILKFIGKKLPDFEIYQNAVRGKSGVEIGGPSLAFKTILPIYQVINNLDGVNFSLNTIWEGSIQSGKTFKYFKKNVGEQYVSEATNLDLINSESYDFLLSSNCLEHVANPFQAIEEWKRVIKPNGFMLLVLPNKNSNFDHNRAVTTFQHLLEDFNNGTTEADLTHLEEILTLHDLSRDIQAGDYENFKSRSLDNLSNRGLHHHVFDMQLLYKIFDYFGLMVCHSMECKSDYYILGMKK